MRLPSAIILGLLLGLLLVSLQTILAQWYALSLDHWTYLISFLVYFVTASVSADRRLVACVIVYLLQTSVMYLCYQLIFHGQAQFPSTMELILSSQAALSLLVECVIMLGAIYLSLKLRMFQNV